MLHVLVTGSNGQLGREISALSILHPELTFDFKSRSELDITDAESIARCLSKSNYDYLINCAAYTQVDKAESEVDECIKINTIAPLLLSHLCLDHNIRMIHISSDYVYNYEKESPLVETDPCLPDNTYAYSKLKGEENILKVSDNNIVIRTSWLYSTYGNNFVKTMLRLAESRDELSIVNDQIGAPTYAKDLAIVLVQIIKHIELNRTSATYGGIYNYSNKGQTNWYEFAKEIFAFSHKNITLQPIPTIAYPTPASRPKWSVMNNNKIEKTFQIKRRNWQEALKEMMSELVS